MMYLKTGHRMTAYYVDVVRDQILIGWDFENGVWSASLSVEFLYRILLWSKGTVHFSDHQTSHKHQVIDTLIFLKETNTSALYCYIFV